MWLASNLHCLCSALTVAQCKRCPTSTQKHKLARSLENYTTPLVRQQSMPGQLRQNMNFGGAEQSKFLHVLSLDAVKHHLPYQRIAPRLPAYQTIVYSLYDTGTRCVPMRALAARLFSCKQRAGCPEAQEYWLAHKGPRRRQPLHMSASSASQSSCRSAQIYMTVTLARPSRPTAMCSHEGP